MGELGMAKNIRHTKIDNAYRKNDMRRNLERFSRFNISGLFPTTKDSSPHFFESFNEAHFAVMFEFDPTIVSVKSQPFTIKYLDGKSVRVYTPDYSITDCNNVTKFIEVKVSEALDEKQNRKHGLIKKAFNEHGLEFHVMTEKHLPSRLALSNMMMIKRNATALGEVNFDALNYLLNILSVPTSLATAVSICDSLNIDTNLISYCILRDYLKIGLSSNFSGESVLFSNIYEGELCPA